MNLGLTPEVAGLIVVVVVSILLVGLSVLGRRSAPNFRSIPAFSRLRRAVGLAVENGKGVHFSIGRGSLVSPSATSAFAGLSMLRQIGARTAVGDQPPVVTAGDSVLAILGQDTLRSAYRAAGAEDLFKGTTGRLAGLTPFSYAAGTLPALRDENASVHVLIGNFGVELAFIADAADSSDAFTLAGSDDLSAQAVLFATVPGALIGEEVYAGGAYLDAGPMHGASLRVQDILRWVIFIAVLAAAGLKLVGLL